MTPAYKIVCLHELYFVVDAATDTAVSSWSTEELAQKEIERLSNAKSI